MIPKVIHYCWFGGNPLPGMAVKCIASWKKYLPDYEIVEWNERNFDVHSIPYTSEAYANKKYAFVSDYARFYVLYHNGGIYMDVDVEVIQPLELFLEHKMFGGFETNDGVNPGLILGAEKGTSLFKEVLDEYLKKEFVYVPKKMDTVVSIFTSILSEKGLILNGDLQKIEDMTVYPTKYFSPINFFTGERNITSNTYSIHHYAATWAPLRSRLKVKILKYSFFRYLYKKIK